MTATAALYASGAIALMPASLSASAQIWAEPAVTAAFLACLLVTIRYLEEFRVARGVAAITIAAVGYLAHARLLPLLVTIIALTVGGAMAKRRWRLAIALAFASLASASFVYGFSWLVVRELWEHPSQVNTAGSTLARISEPGAVAASALGQAWYLLASSALVFGIGATVIIRSAKRHGPNTMAARTLLVLTAPLVTTSVIFVAGRPRTDMLIYGRYNDAVVWPILIAGLGWVIDVRTLAYGQIVRTGTMVATAAMACALVLALANGDVLRNFGGERVMIPGIVFSMFGGDVNPALTTLFAIGTFAFVVWTVRSRLLGRHSLEILAVGVLATVGTVSYRELDREVNLWGVSKAVTEVATRLPPGEDVGFRFATIDGAPAVSFSNQTRFALAYQWFLPGHRFRRDHGLTDDVGPFVFATLADPDLNAAGGEVLWVDPVVQIVLWREPEAHPTP